MNDTIELSNKAEKPYKVEVIADNSGKFCGNALQFESIDQAKEYAADLMSRWLLVSNWRIVHIPDNKVVAQLHTD